MLSSPSGICKSGCVSEHAAHTSMNSLHAYHKLLTRSQRNCKLAPLLARWRMDRYRRGEAERSDFCMFFFFSEAHLIFI